MVVVVDGNKKAVEKVKQNTRSTFGLLMAVVKLIESLLSFITFDAIETRTKLVGYFYHTVVVVDICPINSINRVY